MWRISKYAIALVLVAALGRAEAQQQKLAAPLYLASLEWLVADADVIVRGVVSEVATDQSWNLVTLDVLETLKGKAGERVQFVAYRFEKGDAALADAKQAKREQLWILKHRESGVPGEAPERARLLAKHKIDHYAAFLPGRPGDPSLPAISLGSEAGVSFLGVDLRLLKTPEEINKAIRAAIAFGKDQKDVAAYSLSLPESIAKRTGFSRSANEILMPRDSRLEATARKLVKTPGEFLSNEDASQKQTLRLEGVKTLRQFPSEANLAIVREWLDDPNSTKHFVGNHAALVPAAPRQPAKVALPTELTQVPEIHFQQPLTKAIATPQAQLHTAVTIDGVHLLNQKKTDAYLMELTSKRPDLSGLSFMMGDACRMKPEEGKKFVAALDVFRKVESSIGDKSPNNALISGYKAQASEKKLDPSASVASLMQVLGHEDADKRLGLAKYLGELENADSTKALAKLAIFSAETEIRTAAIEVLQKRNAKDYTDILLSGLKYPWPAVAERAGEALVQLGRKDLVPQLIDVLDRPDPRSPQTEEADGKKISFVREVVRVNHHHNCLLCHAPAATPEKMTKEDAKNLEGLTAQVPVPSESMVAYYRPSVPDILVRFDVTYLRQDFSMKIKVADADPWPEMQRYDFLVRTREVTPDEAVSYRQLLQPAQGELTPYHRAAVSALRELTGRDAEPTAAAWRKAISQ